MFWCSVKGTGYPLRSPVSPSLPSTVRHRVPSNFNWSQPDKGNISCCWKVVGKQPCYVALRHNRVTNLAVEKKFMLCILIVFIAFFTDLMHQFFILIHLLHSCTCFEHCCAHLQEDNSISTASGMASSLSLGDCSDHSLREESCL